MKRIQVVGLLFLGMIFLSCASGGRNALTELARIPLPPYLPPTSAELPEYRIDFGDLLEVKFFNNERFDASIRVRPDGRITLLRVGDLLVVGRTPTEVDSLITAVYAGIIKDPEITVIVREFGAPEVYVLGEVPKPGAYPFRGRLTALQAVALAGGPGREAKMASVLIIRQERGELVAARWDLKEMITGDITRGDPPVLPFDVIYVPRSFISKVGEFLDQYLLVILTPLDISMRWLYYQRLLEQTE